jgi:hypothetical protein
VETARTHAVCVSLSFFNNVNQRGICIPCSCACHGLWRTVCTTDKPLYRFPLAGFPAGLADRALISHRGVGAFAPASLSDAVYRFNPSELSNKIRKVFYFFYNVLKTIDLSVVHRLGFWPALHSAGTFSARPCPNSRGKRQLCDAHSDQIDV